MEKKEFQNQNQEKLSLEEFQKEIQKIKEAEEKGELKSGHFLNAKEFNVKDLTEEDRKIYEDFKNGTLTREKFDEYYAKIPKDQLTRAYYAAYLANKLTVELIKKAKEKIKS